MGDINVNHICVIFCFNNFEHTQTCYESLKKDNTDFFIVENNSENSDKFQSYFKNEKLAGYIQFEDNITYKALEIFIKDFKDLLKKYSYITITDGDLVVGDSEETFKEIFKNLNYPNVGVSCVDLSLDNFPSHVPNSQNWLPTPISENENYIECKTGGHLMTVKRDNLFLFDGRFIDTSISNVTYNAKLKWVKTKINKAYHLTWDLYVEGNPYYEFKIQNQDLLWNHSNISPYLKII